LELSLFVSLFAGTVKRYISAVLAYLKISQRYMKTMMKPLMCRTVNAVCLLLQKIGGVRD
jgi:hypothetical protein